MNGGIYLRHGDDLVRMVEAPYEKEEALQQLLENHPALLAGDRDNAGQGGWLLIAREATLASEPDGGGRWSVDHLFIDRAGIPTLVEVKRSSDTRIRREVVGQMLDYAANAVVHWELPKLRATFDAGPPIRGVSPEERLAQFLGPDANPDEFWDLVKTNLSAGKLRLVFVADEIPGELRRIVEFLNEQMTTTEVFAIEVKQYRDASGEHQTLVPRLIGQTEAARQAKGKPAPRRWDEASFMARLAENHPLDEVAVVEKIFAWAKGHRPPLNLVFGTGRTTAGFQPGLKGELGYVFPFSLYPGGGVYINFGTMVSAPYPPFDRSEKREQLCELLMRIPGVEIPEDKLDKNPGFALAALVPEASYAAFIEAIEWCFAEARASASTSRP